MFGFSEEDVAVIKQSLMPAGASENDLKLFLAQSKRTGLDPLSRQIYASGFKEKDRNGNYTGGIKLSVGVTIDGFRVIAERTGKYVGQDGPYWCGPDGEWRDVWLKDEPPTACKIGVMRADFEKPLWAVAKFKSYNQGGNVWARLPEQMLAKCAEMLALRKAFPNDLGGLYGKEEMGSGGMEEEQVVASPEGLQQALAATEAKNRAGEATGKGNNARGRQAAQAEPVKQDAEKAGAAGAGADTGRVQQKGPEDKAKPGDRVATDKPTSAGSGTKDGEDFTATGPVAAKSAAITDPTITEEQLVGVLHIGLSQGFTEEEISEWIEATFGVNEDTVLTLKKSQLDQARAHFGKKKI